jgi:hypothetical protein
MDLQDIDENSNKDQLAEAMNNSAVEIQKAADHLKMLKDERAAELKRIHEFRGDFVSGTTKVYLSTKKSDKQAAPGLIMEAISRHCEKANEGIEELEKMVDPFSTLAACLGSKAFKKGSTQKIIGKNVTLFWTDEDETITEKFVKEVNTDFLD